MYVLLTGGVALVPMRHLEHRNATPFSKIMTPFFGKKCYICATETKSLRIKEYENKTLHDCSRSNKHDSGQLLRLKQ